MHKQFVWQDYFCTGGMAAWENIPRGLIPLGAMGAPLRAPLEPVGVTYCCDARGV